MHGGRAPTYPEAMDAASDPRRLAGAFRFIGELSSVAAECARRDEWSDELTTRRKLRAEVVANARPELVLSVSKGRPARKAL